MSEHDVNLQETAKAVEGINKAFEAFKEKNDARMAELEAKGSADVVTREEIKKIEAEMDKLDKVAQDAVLAVKRSQRIAEADDKAAEIEAKAARWGVSSAKSFGASGAADFTADRMAEYKAANQLYLRKGHNSLTADEIKALSVGGDPDGGYVVNPDMSGRIVDRMFDTSPVRAYASIQTIGTDALEGLIDDDEAAFGWVEETEARPETDTPQLGKWRIPAHEMYANPAATQRLLDDAEIDMEAWLAGKVADKFARGEAAAFVNGSGVGRPRGFLTYADWDTAGTYQRGAIEQFDTGVDGEFAAAPAGGDILIDTMTALQTRYRNNANWFMNRGTQGAVRKLKDSDGAYLWQPGIAAGQPATLLGYSVAIFEDMPNIATGSLSMAFGDMQAAYQIVDRAGIRVLRDPYTNKPYVHFYTTKRVGGDVLDFSALKLVRFAA